MERLTGATPCRTVWMETHLHTRNGSHDGSITLPELITFRESHPGWGVCLTDHDYVWPRRSVEELARQVPGLVVSGVEVTTELGHVLAYGLDEYVPGIHRIDKLRREVEQVGGVMVLAHPFRSELSPYYQYGHRPPGLPAIEEVARRPVFDYVDALEACNGTGTAAEEEAVRTVALMRGLPVTGGSDAHGAGALGRCATQFSTGVSTEREFIEAVLSGGTRAFDLRGGKGVNTL